MRRVRWALTGPIALGAVVVRFVYADDERSAWGEVFAAAPSLMSGDDVGAACGRKEDAFDVQACDPFDIGMGNPEHRSEEKELVPDSDWGEVDERSRRRRNGTNARPGRPRLKQDQAMRACDPIAGRTPARRELPRSIATGIRCPDACFACPW